MLHDTGRRPPPRYEGLADYALLDSGLLVPRQTAVDYVRPRPTCVDLFAGAGGMSLGMIEAGFEVVCAVEHDAYAAITYLVNLGQWPMPIHFVTDSDRQRLDRALMRCAGIRRKADRRKADADRIPRCGEHRPPERTPVRSFIFGDAREVTGELISRVSGVDRGQLDLVSGGPPCQGFSYAGKRNVYDARNSLVFEMARLIWELQPRTYAFENVPGIQTMVTPEGLPVLDVFKNIAERGHGYYEALKNLHRTMNLKPRILNPMTVKPEPKAATDQPSLL